MRTDRHGVFHSSESRSRSASNLDARVVYRSGDGGGTGFSSSMNRRSSRCSIAIRALDHREQPIAHGRWRSCSRPAAMVATRSGCRSVPAARVVKVSRQTDALLARGELFELLGHVELVDRRAHLPPDDSVSDITSALGFSEIAEEHPP